MRRQQGFTMLEVLIAIGLTAMIGVGVWQLLNTALSTQEVTFGHMDELESLQRAMVIMSRDFTQLTTRPTRDEFGDSVPALSNRNQLYLLELTRAGWRNPLKAARSDLQRVRYELVESELRRGYWPVLDIGNEAEPRLQTLVSGIESMAVRFLDSQKEWQTQWPTDALLTKNELAAFPVALEITLVHQRYGSLRRLYDLPQWIPPTITAAGGGGNGSGNGGTGENEGTTDTSDTEGGQVPTEGEGQPDNFGHDSSREEIQPMPEPDFSQMPDEVQE